MFLEQVGALLLGGLAYAATDGNGVAALIGAGSGYVAGEGLDD